MNVLSDIQTIHNTWEQTQLAAAKVAAARDMNNFNLELLKNRDYTKWQDMYQTFDQQMKDTYATQLGDKGLADQFSNWYTGEASKQKLNVVGQAVQQMTTDSINATKNTVASAVQNGDFAGVDMAIQTARDHNLFSPSEADAMRANAHHEITYNTAFNALTDMSEPNAAAWLQSDWAQKNLSTEDRKNLLTTATPVIKAKQTKKWDGNYGTASNAILNGSISPTYDELAGMLTNDNVDKVRYDDLIALKKAKEARDSAGSGAKADPRALETYRILRNAMMNGGDVPTGLFGAQQFGGKKISRSDLRDWLIPKGEMLGQSFATSEMKGLEQDYPKTVLEGVTQLRAIAAKNKWTPEQTSEAISRLYDWADTSNRVADPTEVSRTVGTVAAGIAAPSSRDGS